jgi:hypothetical protein
MTLVDLAMAIEKALPYSAAPDVFETVIPPSHTESLDQYSTPHGQARRGQFPKICAW